ncbi:MAG: hypothetical protein Q6363_008070 [Candidatus Njordarchaeota archaeon]
MAKKKPKAVEFIRALVRDNALFEALAFMSQRYDETAIELYNFEDIKKMRISALSPSRTRIFIVDLDMDNVFDIKVLGFGKRVHKVFCGVSLHDMRELLRVIKPQDTVIFGIGGIPEKGKDKTVGISVGSILLQVTKPNLGTRRFKYNLTLVSEAFNMDKFKKFVEATVKLDKGILQKLVKEMAKIVKPKDRNATVIEIEFHPKDAILRFKIEPPFQKEGEEIIYELNDKHIIECGGKGDKISTRINFAMFIEMVYVKKNIDVEIQFGQDAPLMMIQNFSDNIEVREVVAPMVK